MLNVIMKFGDFTYHSEPDQDDDVTKMMHYVFYRDEFIGMMPVSSYKAATFDEFKEYCEQWTRKPQKSEVH